MSKLLYVGEWVVVVAVSGFTFVFVWATYDEIRHGWGWGWTLPVGGTLAWVFLVVLMWRDFLA